ncbi:hypothetical protein TRVA0_026S00430 [Trichomonascus vanleenenianus]|uniref:uncharacterized protein n=1 Tax=Trichomonascus vanleenenianus TaxID=2268995 RepID=UPI003EC9FBE4
MLPFWVFFILASLVCGSSLTVPVLLQPAGSADVVTHGSITYDTSMGEARFSPESQEKYTGKACIGIGFEGSDFECLAYGDVQPEAREEYTLHLNADGKVIKLDYSRNLSAEGHAVKIFKAASGPMPQVKQPIKLVNNEVPKEEPPKTFLQKYWMYIVPVVLMLMVSGGGEGR